MRFISCVLLIVVTVVSSEPEAGSCPPTLPVDMCEARCGRDVSCPGVQLCCPTECGGAMCVDPMTRRHFVTQEKPGKCPQYPRGPWICSHMCTGDGDCPRALKCCPNRCKAMTCQKPDSEEEGLFAPSPAPWEIRT